MAPEHLRPLRAQEIVDAGFGVARRVIPRTLFPMLIVIAPIAVLAWIAQFAFLSAETDDLGVTTGEFQLDNAFGIVIAVVQLAALAAAIVVCMPATLESFTGTPPAPWGANLRLVIRRTPAALVVLVLGGLVVLPIGVILGGLFAIAAGITVILWLVFISVAVAGVVWFIAAFGPLALMAALFCSALPALFTEHTGGAKSISRSWQLGFVRLFSYAGVMLLVMAIAFVAWIALQLALLLVLQGQSLGSPSIDSAASVTLGALATVLLAPAFAGVMTAIYFDARVRREGLDLAWALADVPAAS